MNYEQTWQVKYEEYGGVNFIVLRNGGRSGLERRTRTVSCEDHETNTCMYSICTTTILIITSLTLEESETRTLAALGARRRESSTCQMTGKNREMYRIVCGTEELSFKWERKDVCAGGGRKENHCTITVQTVPLKWIRLQKIEEGIRHLESPSCSENTRAVSC